MKKILIKVKSNLVSFIDKNRKYCLIGVLVIVIILIVIIAICLKAPISNIPGNLYTGGFAVSNKNYIYYSKIEDGDNIGIYKIKKNGNNSKEVSNETGMYFNVYEDYLYYIEINQDDYKYNIVKMKLNGKNKEILVNDVNLNILSVSDGWIYYTKNNKFYKIKTNGKDEKKISNKVVLSFQIIGKWIYYSYENEGNYYIAKMKTNGEKITKLTKEASPYFYVKNSKIYYIKQEYNNDNYEYKYILCKMKTNGKKQEQITELEKNIKQINMTDKEIYYITSENYENCEIKSIDYKGKEIKTITGITNYAFINIVDNWIFYKDKNENNEEIIFKIKVNGKYKQGL